MQKFWLKKVDPDEKVLENRLFWLLRSAPLSYLSTTKQHRTFFKIKLFYEISRFVFSYNKQDNFNFDLVSQCMRKWEL